MALTLAKLYFSALLVLFIQIRRTTTIKIFTENCSSMNITLSVTDEVLNLLKTYSKLAIDPIETGNINCKSSFDALQTVCELSSKNDISSKAFYVSCGMGHQLKSTFDNLGIKYEKKSDSNCLTTNYQENRLRSRPSDVVLFIKDMMTRFGWNKIVLITDIETEMLQQELSNTYTTSIIVHPPYIAEYLNITKPYLLHYFVLCSPAVTRQVLQFAIELKAIDSPHSWVVMSDISKEVLLQDVKIPFNSYVAVATTSDDKVNFVPHKATLLWTLENQPSTSCSNLNQIQTSDSKTKLIDSNHRILIMDLYEVYSVKPDMPLKSRFFGKWVSSTNAGYRLDLKHSFPNMLRELDGISFDVVTVETPPYIIINNKIDTLEGIYGHLFQTLAMKMNFTYNLTVERTYGLKEANDWTGSMKLIAEKKADIALCDFSMTIDRKEIGDFSSTISTAVLKTIYRLPDENYHFRLYIIPFGWQIWVLVTVSIVVSGVLIYITNRVSPNSALKNAPDATELAKIKDKFSMQDCLLAVYNGFNQQGSELEPREVSGKIIFVTVYLSFVIIFSSYTSVFTSFLTISNTKILFPSLTDVYENNAYKIGLCEYTSQESLFKDETKPESFQYKVWKRIEQDPGNVVSNLKEGLNRAYSQDYALITPKETTNYFLNNNCSFEFSSDDVFKESNHLIYRKDFIYAETFNNYISLLYESGSIQRLHRMYKQDEIKFCSSENVKPLGFKKVVSLYLLLAGASLFAAAALAVEWLFRMTEETKGRNKDISNFILNVTSERNDFKTMVDNKDFSAKVERKNFSTTAEIKSAIPKTAMLSKSYHFS